MAEQRPLTFQLSIKLALFSVFLDICEIEKMD